MGTKLKNSDNDADSYKDERDIFYDWIACGKELKILDNRIIPLRGLLGRKDPAAGKEGKEQDSVISDQDECQRACLCEKKDVFLSYAFGLYPFQRIIEKIDYTDIEDF